MVRGDLHADAASTQALFVGAQQFSLHAAVRWEVNERPWLELLCHNITCQVLANKGKQCNAARQAALKLKSAWRDSIMQLVMLPLDFMPRRAS
jgi:hypothetical protein